MVELIKQQNARAEVCLDYLYYFKEKALNLWKFSEDFFLNDPELRSDIPTEYLSHKEKYEEAIRRACIIFRKVQELQEQGKGGVQNFR